MRRWNRPRASLIYKVVHDAFVFEHFVGFDEAYVFVKGDGGGVFLDDGKPDSFTSGMLFDNHFDDFQHSAFAIAFALELLSNHKPGHPVPIIILVVWNIFNGCQPDDCIARANSVGGKRLDPHRPKQS
ncbi:hypothetical protein BN1002_03429 [Bacillus sp. B-jedd]|nr:hypothetical protein BN1002_03429 [Bacillus sp. B-jedd]